jgi:hypothetical protein
MNTVNFLDILMGNIFGVETDTPIPSSFYLGVSSTEPDIYGNSFTEPSSNGTGYARVALTSITGSHESYDSPGSAYVTNGELVSFPESLSDWGTISHWGIFDSATGGTLLMYGELYVSRAVETGTVVAVKPQELIISLTNPS